MFVGFSVPKIWLIFGHGFKPPSELYLQRVRKIHMGGKTLRLLTAIAVYLENVTR